MRVAALLFALLLGVLALRAPAGAADLFPAGATGFDISFPQCGSPLPNPPFGFAIVGATGGRAFTENRCLSEQYRWASIIGRQPGLYLNVKSPVGSNAEQALTGPMGTCQPTDELCKGYNFGYKTAQHAVAYAKAQSATPASWWLDVETTSSWLTDPIPNARVIQGAIDFLQTQGVPVGIYSNPAQWQTIAGSYSPGLPVWTTMANTAAEAPAMCWKGFGGGQVVLVQYIEGGFDTNYACRNEDRVPPPPIPPLGPAGTIATIAADGDCLRVRALPSLTASIQACLPTGARVTLLEGAVLSDGHRWQFIATNSHTGWVSTSYLRVGTSTPAPAPTPVPAPAPTPPPGTFVAKPVFGPSRVSLVVFNGGTVEQLEASARGSGATGVWAQELSGAYQLLVVDGPAFVNAPFRAAFPGGLRAATALTLTQ
ncbi:MAG: hypothetical protein AB7G21_01120 [Dehalococcoidia bacterium]